MSIHAISTTPPVEPAAGAQPEDGERPSFADFWCLYPRRVAKQAARRAWERLSPADQIEALVGLVAWGVVWRFQAQQREDFLDYLPHPASKFVRHQEGCGSSGMLRPTPQP